MNWDQMAGQWKQMMGSARTKWGQITDDEWHKAAGRRDRIAGLVQERYGRSREEAEREVDDWLRDQRAPY